jgi:hypothetical protein
MDMIDLDFHPTAVAMRRTSSGFWALVDTFGNTVDVTDEAGALAIQRDEDRLYAAREAADGRTMVYR